MDLTPDIKLPLVQLNHSIKQRAFAVLAKAGIDSLDAVGGAFWADILFVTSRKRSSLNSQHLEALGKASAGLGYAATQYALLSDVNGGGRSPSLQDYIDAYVQALSVDTVVFLEATPITDHPFTRVVTVTDFFASLDTTDDQQAKKQQAWQELQAAKRQPALR